ncbi:MAG: CotH kinase family protein [Granulosicoccus sp.]
MLNSHKPQFAQYLIAVSRSLLVGIRLCVLLTASFALVACGGNGSEPDAAPVTPEILDEGPEVEDELPDPELDPTSQFDPGQIVDDISIYSRDGYGQVNVVRMDVRTVPGSGPCTADVQSGCTLEDVIADTDINDELVVDIPVHFKAADYPDDGLVNNAELRQRGGGTRAAPQKSFRLKLDDRDRLWRGERHLQLNKHPFDSSRIRNKLAFDLMSEIPHLISFRTQFVNLWIDDGDGPVDYGLFTHVERGDERFLRRRGIDDDTRLYKAENFRFTEFDLLSLKLDDDGQPVNEEAFEEVLEIESGDEHENLLEMLAALHDSSRSFDSVLQQHFDESNVLTWLAVNLLLGQWDTVRHNYFLLNPVNSDRFHFLPWDYDSAFIEHVEPANDFETGSLRDRLRYGYASSARNDFIASYYRLPGAHDRIVQMAENIRQNYLTSQNVTEKGNLYATVAEPYVRRSPDSDFNEFFLSAPGEGFAQIVERNLDSIKNRFSYPLPPVLETPVINDGQWQFRWRSAYDLTGHSISYDLLIATSPEFLADSVVTSIEGISDDEAGIIEQAIDTAGLLPSRYYARVIARVSNEPQRYWQINSNQLTVDDTLYYGLVEFDNPQQ